MKFVILLTLYCAFSQASELNKVLEMRTTSKDLRNETLIIEIKSSTQSDDVKFIENNDQVEVKRNKRKIKISSSKVMHYEELFVKSFIEFKYGQPRDVSLSCNKAYALFFRGDSLDICNDEKDKIIKIQHFIKTISRL